MLNDRNAISQLIQVFIIVLLLLFTTSACSNKSWYMGIQTSQRFDCLHLPESEQASCFASVEMSYKEYERQRLLLLKKE